MQGLLDVHAHLAAPEFGEDLAAVLERARRAGVAAVVTVGESLAEARRILALADEHPGVVLPCAGLFPTRLDPGEAAEVEAFVREHRHRLVAVGEVGLDQWKVREPAGREVQRDLFVRMVRVAIETGLPLNVHSRATGRETIAALLEEGAGKVVMHAFDGKASTAAPALEAGYLFSIPPSVVRSRQKQKLVRHLPLASLLLETDSPVLGPDPAARNEPANLAVALDAVAEIRGLPREAVAEAVAENARRLFGVALA